MDGLGVVGLLRLEGRGVPDSFLWMSSKRPPGTDIKSERVAGQLAKRVIESSRGSTKRNHAIIREFDEKEFNLV